MLTSTFSATIRPSLRPITSCLAALMLTSGAACAAGDAPASAAASGATSGATSGTTSGATSGAASATGGALPDPEFIHPDGPPANPFSPAVRVGNLIFVSGTLGTGPDGKLVPGGIQAETRQVLENIKAVLATSNVGMDRVVKCTAFLADLAEWPAMNEVYRSYFVDNKYPARAAVQATLLFGARVELECVAAAR